MRLLIIEDEAYAVDELKRLLGKIKLPSEPEVLEALDSIAGAVRWLRSHPHPDLVFLDIQLADGMSFDIFNQVDIKCPVIFTTAYDEYAIRAFKMNSIDYLLKPIEQKELQAAFDKYFKLRDSLQQAKPVYQQLANVRNINPHSPFVIFLNFAQRLLRWMHNLGRYSKL